MNLTFITFALLAVVPPIYTRYEHLHRREDPIPTQLKWTAQVAVGSGAAAHSVCRIVTRVRGSDPNTLGGSFYCSALGVAGGAMSSGAMARRWDERDWAYFQRVTDQVSWMWEGKGGKDETVTVKVDGEARGEADVEEVEAATGKL